MKDQSTFQSPTYDLDLFGGNLRAVLASTMAPVETMTVSEWADAHRLLSDTGSNPEPGPYKTDRTPYLREIMDCASNPEIPIAVCRKSSQVGFTEALLNIIGYHIQHDPTAMALIEPSQKPMCEDISNDRIDPMLRDTPSLTGLVAPPGSKTKEKGRNTTLHKEFKGGSLTLIGATSPAGLASRPIRIMLYDEVDRYPISAGREGDPIELGSRRQSNFWNRFTFIGGTPTITNASAVDTWFDESDQRFYRVPCPHCKVKSALKWADIDFSRNGTTAAPVWNCPECSKPVSEDHKAAMLAGGEWVAEKEFQGIAGFSINALYSPFESSGWADVVSKFLMSKDHPEKLKVWTNTYMGETWDLNQVVEAESSELMLRRENYDAIPADVLVITAGVDWHPDRWEITVWGYSERQRWMIEHAVIEADTEDKRNWKHLDEYLFAPFEHELGVDMTIAATGVDSGNQTRTVYAYCAKRYRRRVFAVKGKDGQDRDPVAVMAKPKTPGPKPPKMFIIGVEPLKRVLLAALSILDPSKRGFVHFPMEADDDYFDQLTAERQVIKKRMGKTIIAWEKVRERNEALDCAIYSDAALLLLNVDWPAVESNLKERAAAVPTAEQRADLEAAAGNDAEKRVDYLSNQIKRRKTRRGKRGRLGLRK